MQDPGRPSAEVEELPRIPLWAHKAQLAPGQATVALPWIWPLSGRLVKMNNSRRSSRNSGRLILMDSQLHSNSTTGS